MGKQIPVEFRVTGLAVGKMRNEMTAQMLAPEASEDFEFATDEGQFHGGDATAPPPLAFFVTSWAACLMTQIRAFARRLGVDLQGLQVEGGVRWLAEMQDFGGYSGSPDRFRMGISIQTSSAPEAVGRLVTAARGGCFVEQSLHPDIDVEFTVHVNGDALAVLA